MQELSPNRPMEDNQQNKKEKSESNYWAWAFLTGVLVFVGVWIYAMAEWGLLLGIMFGWIPAIIAAFVGGLLWPLIAIVILGFIGLMLFYS